MKRFNVYVTRMIPQQTIDDLRQFHDVEVNPHDRALTRDELLKAVRGRDAVITLLTDTIDGEVLDAAGAQCKIFANYAVGFNNFDLQAATRRGVNAVATSLRVICATESPGSTSSPPSPSAVAVSPTGVATTGRALAIASSTNIGITSKRDGSTATRHAASSGPMRSRGTWPSTSRPTMNP